MSDITYVNIDDLDRAAFLKILNKDKLRKHLVSHSRFDSALLDEWIEEKRKIDSTTGCKVKGIIVNGAVAGWCGIQFENDAYELAIVLDEDYWGLGIAIFKDLMHWARGLGHNRVVLHLLNTRPEYQFLRKMAARVYESTLFGQSYTSYELCVPQD